MRVITLLAAAAALAAAAEPAKHAFNVDDWASLRSALPAAVSSDGATILAAVTYGGPSGPTHYDWELIGNDGSNVRHLETPEHFSPVGFTPDGTGLYGTFEVNNLQQFVVFTIAGLKKSSTPSLVVTLPRGVHSARISPDGARYALLADPRPPDDLAGVRTVVEPDVTGIYVISADGVGGKWWCGGLKAIAGPLVWAPDSSKLAVLSAEPKIGNYASMKSSLDVCDASGARRIADVSNSASGLAWADGGRELAFLSTTTTVLTPDHLWTVAADGGKPADRTPKLNGSAVNLTGDPSGKVWVSIDRGVQNEIDSYADGVLTPAYRWPGGYVAGMPVFSELRGGSKQVALSVADPLHADNIAVPGPAGELRKITHEGDDQLGAVDLGPVHVVKWTSKEGIPLEGIATFPAGYTEGRKYPFLVLPHGGPESNDELALDPFPRIVAGLGYVVLQPEYRGSTGYGSEFLNAIYQHFGDRAYRDVDSAADFAIAQGWADPNRLAIFGWSAGGFMTSWTVTQTHRYKAAIEGAGITDWASFMWTSDVQQYDYDARWPEENLAAFTQFSAVMYARQVTTPLLILHGAADLRVPTFQGQELYESLAARGKTTRLVTYPGSPHFPRLWEQRRDVFRELAAWLAKYNP